MRVEGGRLAQRALALLGELDRPNGGEEDGRIRRERIDWQTELREGGEDGDDRRQRRRAIDERDRLDRAGGSAPPALADERADSQAAEKRKRSRMSIRISRGSAAVATDEDADEVDTSNTGGIGCGQGSALEKCFSFAWMLRQSGISLAMARPQDCACREGPLRDQRGLAQPSGGSQASESDNN